MIIPKGSTSSKLVHCFIEDFGNFVYNFSGILVQWNYIAHCFILFYIVLFYSFALVFNISNFCFI